MRGRSLQNGWIEIGPVGRRWDIREKRGGGLIHLMAHPNFLANLKVCITHTPAVVSANPPN